MRLFEQIERSLSRLIGQKSKSHKWDKQKQHRIERKRAKQDPNAQPLYRKYKGYEY